MIEFKDVCEHMSEVINIQEGFAKIDYITQNFSGIYFSGYSIGDLEQIISKMKKLQSEVK